MAERTYNEALLDALLRHQIGILRFAGSVRNRVWELLDATESDLRRQIAAAKRAGVDSPASRKQLERLLRGLRETRSAAWKKSSDLIFKEMRALAEAEPGFIDNILQANLPVELGTTLPSTETLRRVAVSTPFVGRTLSEWSKNMRAADIARIETAVKIGLAQGDSLPAITRAVVGTRALRGRNGRTQATRRDVATVVRTVTNGIGAEARSLYAEVNSDLISHELFIATLDSRTTPICRANDGKLFEVGKGPRFPLHMGERSLYSFVVNGEVIGDRPRRSFTERSLLREFAARRNLPRVPTKRAQLPHGTKGAYDAFARKRMRELTGIVPARTTYQQFLTRELAANQDDILGPTRGKLFRKGGLTLDKFVEADGTTLTLPQLAERHTQAFLRAGLDPAQFTD